MAGRTKQGRGEAVEEALGRAFGAATLRFEAAVAERLGVGVTDYRCVELLQRAGADEAVTPGLLAERLGLTSGAVTAMLDRLEKAGLVRRDKDPGDRRQVVVRLQPERAREVSGLLEPLRRGWGELGRGLGERELAVIREFMGRAVALLLQEAGELRGAPAPAAPAGAPSTLSAPLAGVARGRLEALRGLSRCTLSAAPADLLYRLRSAGPPPRVTVQGGRVAVEPVRSLARLFSRHAAALELGAAVPWEIALRGGVADVDADLRGLEVAALELGGGLSEVRVRLPRPRGTVPVRVAGGAQKLRLLRPPGAPARVVVASGAHGLVIDTLQLGAVGGELRWETPDYAAAADRYDISVRGGASDITVAHDDLSEEAGTRLV